MPTWTKMTITKFKDTVDSVPTDYLTLAITRLDVLTDAGKTDGVPEFLDMYTIKRVWLDQAAIDEWRAYIDPFDDEYGVVKVEQTVTDI